MSKRLLHKALLIGKSQCSVQFEREQFTVLGKVRRATGIADGWGHV
ncbi:MAG: hypothetical protein ACREVK_12695 [Gammaproteobacteria bacterium]